jgi:hypothetical protein
LEPIGPSFGIEPIGLSLEKFYDDEITSPWTRAYAALPNLASAHEQKLADFEAPTWFAVFLPRGASEPIHPQAQPSSVRNRDTPSVQKRLNVLAPIHRGADFSG